jgi:hypothetical protein
MCLAHAKHVAATWHLAQRSKHMSTTCWQRGNHVAPLMAELLHNSACDILDYIM